MICVVLTSVKLNLVFYLYNDLVVFCLVTYGFKSKPVLSVKYFYARSRACNKSKFFHITVIKYLNRNKIIQVYKSELSQ